MDDVPRDVVRATISYPLEKTMPMQLLERLSCAQLPLKIRDDNAIAKCKFLLAGNLIEADIPPLTHGRGKGAFAAQAIVMSVTNNGKAALDKLIHARETAKSFPFKSIT
jgi:hypothetical protein